MFFLTMYSDEVTKMLGQEFTKQQRPRLKSKIVGRSIYKTALTADQMHHCRQQHLHVIIGRGSNATITAMAATK